MIGPFDELQRHRDRTAEAAMQRARPLIEILCAVPNLAGSPATGCHVLNTDIVFLVGPVDTNDCGVLRKLRLHNCVSKVVS